jgi:hypothetical protein
VKSIANRHQGKVGGRPHFVLLTQSNLFERFEGKQIVAKNEPVFEEVAVSDVMIGVIRFCRVFEQNARFQAGPVVLPDPRQFQFLFFRHAAQESWSMRQIVVA